MGIENIVPAVIRRKFIMPPLAVMHAQPLCGILKNFMASVAWLELKKNKPQAIRDKKRIRPLCPIRNVAVGNSDIRAGRMPFSILAWSQPVPPRKSSAKAHCLGVIQKVRDVGNG